MRFVDFEIKEERIKKINTDFNLKNNKSFDGAALNFPA